MWPAATSHTTTAASTCRGHPRYMSGKTDFGNRNGILSLIGSLGITSEWRSLAAVSCVATRAKEEHVAKRNKLVNTRPWKKDRNMLKNDESMLVSSY